MSAVPSLEDRYRRLLRTLPEPARSRWADEMTETYLEATCADDPEFAEYGSPALADRLDVWRLALRLRLGGPGASARAVQTGATVRWVALLGVLGTGAPAVVGTAASALFLGGSGTPAWQVALPTLAAVLSVAVYGCLVHGSPVARPLAGGLLLVTLLRLGTALPPTIVSVAVLLAVLLLAWTIPLVAALAVEPTRSARPRLWWAGAAGALLVVGGLPWLSLVVPIPISTDTAVAVGLVVVGVGAVLRSHGPAAGAVAVLGALTVLSLLSPVFQGAAEEFAVVQVGAATALTAVVLVCGSTAVRAARRLPAASA